MSFAKKLPAYWKKIRKNWKIKYSLIIWNDSTQHRSFALKLSPRNVFVVVTTSAVLLIVLTAMLIAFTPLRVYVPGYTSPDEYRQYREMAHRVDSVELLLAQNQQYINNFRRILNNEVMPNEMQKTGELPQTVGESDYEGAAQHSDVELELRDEAATLLQTLSTREENASNSIQQKANLQHLLLQMPVDGIIKTNYDAAHKRFGIDIANKRNTLIVCVEDGIVIFAGFDVNMGNVIMVQHHDNVVSVYAHNQEILKQQGAHVMAGEPIATMGGESGKPAYLHFELWHNGFSLNPLDYLTVRKY